MISRAGLVLIVTSLVAVAGCRRTRHGDPSSNNGDPAVAAESGEAGPPSAAMPKIPTAPKDDRPVIVCFGDSLTAGYGTDPGQSYPDALQVDLNLQGYHYRVSNQGVSGNTTKDGVERLNSVLALKPVVVVVEFGGNDGLRGLPIAETRKNMETIISRLVASGTHVVLAGITLPPDYGPQYIKQVNETYTMLAKKHNLKLLPFLLQDVYGVPGDMQADQTHATAKGNQQVAKNVLPLVLPYLKK